MKPIEGVLCGMSGNIEGVLCGISRNIEGVFKSIIKMEYVVVLKAFSSRIFSEDSVFSFLDIIEEIVVM